MNWTKTPPTKTGAYWHRDSIPNQGGREPIAYLRLVEQIHGALVVVGRNPDRNVPVEDLLGEWSGPLVPVEEVEKAWFEAAHAGPGYLWARYQHSRARRIVQGEQV